MTTGNEDEARVAGGYDAVYAALPRSPTLARIWRAHALGAAYPAGFEHISFVTAAELHGMVAALRLPAGGHLLDAGCGMGGPGLWVARASAARLTGVDISDVALAAARRRAEALGRGGRATFVRGSFAASGLAAACADGAMSIDALQYAPDKRAAFGEFARVLRPAARIAIACFEVEPARVAGVPVLGADPIADYAPLLADAGFVVERYDESDGWRERVTATYEAVAAAEAALRAELGVAACAALLAEVSLTLALRPYRRRVIIVAARR